MPSKFAELAVVGVVEPTGRFELVEQEAEALTDDDFAADGATGEFTSHDGDAGSSGQHVDPDGLHHGGNRATGCHSDVAPCGPIDGDAECVGPGGAEARCVLAEQVVCGAVVGLAVVAEAAGHRTEAHCRADRGVAKTLQQVEPAVGLHVEYQVVLGTLFVGQEPADLQTAGVEQDVDLAADVSDLRHGHGDGVAIEQVDAVVVDRSAGGLDCLDGGQSGVAALDPCDLTLDHRRGGALAGSLEALEDGSLEAVLVGRKGGNVFIISIRLRDEIQQVEHSAAGPGQVGRDSRDDAAGGAGDDEH